MGLNRTENQRDVNLLSWLKLGHHLLLPRTSVLLVVRLQTPPETYTSTHPDARSSSHLGPLVWVGTVPLALPGLQLADSRL